jgi:cysteine desulfurase
LDVEKVSTLCKKYNSLFFCDTVASMGKLEIDLTNSGIDLACCSGHKLHATRGIGFLYKKNNLDLIPLHTGGGQEFGLRSGTENLPAIPSEAVSKPVFFENFNYPNI